MMAAKGAIRPVYEVMAESGLPFDPDGEILAREYRDQETSTENKSSYGTRRDFTIAQRMSGI